MSFQRVPDTVEIRVIYELDSEQFMNTYHAQRPGGYNQSQIDAIANITDSLSAPGLLVFQSVNMSYIRTDVLGLDVENDISSTNDTNAGAGSVIEEAIPRSLAFVVARKSGLSGRSARGRIFIGGIPAGALATAAAANAELKSSYADDYLAEFDDFREAIEAVTGWDAVIVSRYQNKAKRSEAVVFPWTVSVYNTLHLGTQRNRLF